jgi:hypothetical protein
MAEVYIRCDKSSGVVTFVHRRPFDPVSGLGKTRDELSKTGFFVNDFPNPTPIVGKKAVAYYDHERKEVTYQYENVELSDKERITLLESAVNELLMKDFKEE